MENKMLFLKFATGWLQFFVESLTIMWNTLDSIGF